MTESRGATKIPKLGRYKAEKVRSLRAAKGMPGTVDAAPVRAHVRFLLESGFSQFAVAAASGVSQGAVSDVYLGAYPRVLLEIGARLMTVGHLPVDVQRGMLVPGVGVRRRLEALQAAGYTRPMIGDQLGVTDAMVREYRLSRRVRWDTWHSVSCLYDRWSGLPGPSVIAARASKRFLLPLEWEGYDIDDPRVSPPRSNREANPAKSMDPEERRTAVERLTREGLTVKMTAARLGVSERQVTRDRTTLRRTA